MEKAAAAINEAYIRGAVDFMHSKVENKGCLVMDITNEGAHYEYIPQHEVHKSRNFAIGLSGIDLTSADGFAYSLGRSIAAAATSAGVGIAASEAGMGGFVASLAASMAGAAMNMATQDRPGPGLGSNGNVSYSRNGKGFKAISVEFDQAEFNRVIDGIKAKVFGRALDEEMSVPEAVETAEQEVEEFKRDIAEFHEEAEKVARIANEAKEEKKASQKLTAAANEQQTPDDKVGKDAEIREKSLELLLAAPNPNENSMLGELIWDCFNSAIYSQAEISPRDQIEAFVPKNKAEAAVKEVTLLRYKLEDFAEKHPDAAELFGKMFVGAMYTLQGIEYCGAAMLGPLGVAAKYSSQEAISHLVDTTVEASAEAAAQHITPNKVLQNEFANTIKLYAYVGLCAGSVKAGKKLVGSLAKGAQQSKRIRKVGEAGTYDKLTKPAGFNDGMEADHVPCQRYLKANGLNTGEGFAVMLTKEQHAKSRTYRNKAKKLRTDTSYRDEMAIDLKDRIAILKEDGSWNEARPKIIKGLEAYKKNNPDLFKKEKK